MVAGNGQYGNGGIFRPARHYRIRRVILRLAIAAALGGLLGWERERSGKAAGARTHMLVSTGAALLVLVPQQMDMSDADLSRVIQGIVTGVGLAAESDDTERYQRAKRARSDDCCRLMVHGRDRHYGGTGARSLLPF